MQGYITQIKSRVDTSGNVIQTLTLELSGDITSLYGLMKKPIEVGFREIQ